jgi:hypothetical protein
MGAVLEEHVGEDGAVALRVQAEPETLARLARETGVRLQPKGALHKLSGLPDDAYHREQV